MPIEEKFSAFMVMWSITYYCKPLREKVQGSNLVGDMNF
jgi:hypothetical protein